MSEEQISVDEIEFVAEAILSADPAESDWGKINKDDARIFALAALKAHREWMGDE